MLRGNPTLILFLCACVILFIGQSTVMVFLIRVVEALGGSTKELGISMLIQSGIELPIMFAAGWILRRFKTQDILVFSFFCYFIKGLAISIAPSIGILYGIMAFSIFCMGLYGFGYVFFANSIVKASEKVRAQSLVVLCMGFGLIVGSTLSGSLIDTVGLNFLLTISWIILLAAALLMLVCRCMYSKQNPAKL